MINIFFDTYALYAILEANKDYEKYAQNVPIITTRLNLMELHYALQRVYGKKKADFCYDFFIAYAVDIDDNTIKMASDFRYLMKRRKLSYIDCIGYILARTMNIKFLTGDEQFKDIENVEFVK